MLELLTAAELADQLKVHPETVRRLVRRGELVAIRIGRRMRFDQRDVAAFLQGKRNLAPVDEGDKINGPQLKAFHAKADDLAKLSGQRAIDWKRNALTAASLRFNRELTSANDLVSVEASWVLDWLEQELEGWRLAASAPAAAT